MFGPISARELAARKPAKLANCFPSHFYCVLPVEMSAQLRDDVMRYGMLDQNLQAVPPTGSVFYIDHAGSSIHPIVAKWGAQRGRSKGRSYLPARL
ncbi:hypothetical protein ACNKHL_16270 [Shigella flexneri]